MPPARSDRTSRDVRPLRPEERRTHPASLERSVGDEQLDATVLGVLDELADKLAHVGSPLRAKLCQRRSAGREINRTPVVGVDEAIVPHLVTLVDVGNTR